MCTWLLITLLSTALAEVGRFIYLEGFFGGLWSFVLFISIQPTQVDNEQSFANFWAVYPQNWQSLSNGPKEQRQICLNKQHCNFDYMKEQNLFTGRSVSRRIRVDIQVPELIKVTSQFIYLDFFKRMNNYLFAGYVCVNSRVVHDDINFGILRDPLNFLFPMDPKRPYWTKFLIRNGSFLLTNAHAFGANWTERPPTSKAFLGHLSLWKGVWNVSRINELALRFPKMVWKSRIGSKMTELRSFENYQFSKIRVAVVWCSAE